MRQDVNPELIYCSLPLPMPLSLGFFCCLPQCLFTYCLLSQYSVKQELPIHAFVEERELGSSAKIIAKIILIFSPRIKVNISPIDEFPSAQKVSLYLLVEVAGTLLQKESRQTVYRCKTAKTETHSRDTGHPLPITTAIQKRIFRWDTFSLVFLASEISSNWDTVTWNHRQPLDLLNLYPSPNPHCSSAFYVCWIHINTEWTLLTLYLNRNSW